MELTEERYHNLSEFSRTCVYCNRPVYRDDYNSKNYVMVAKKHRFILSHKTCFLKYLKFCKESKKEE